MRADWILTDEERTNKRLKIEENRRLRESLYPDSPDVSHSAMNNSSPQLFPSVAHDRTINT